mgnify:CR=1 FL=1
MINRLSLPSFPRFQSLLWGCCLALIVGGLSFWGSLSALAAPRAVDLSRQPAQEITVSLGNEEDELRFFPDHFKFMAGQHYKLILENLSPQKHYFTAKDFADMSWTQKVEAQNVEIKGAIHELELKPGARAEWVFVPIRTGTYNLRCTVPGHTEAGMVGEIAISLN